MMLRRPVAGKAAAELAREAALREAARAAAPGLLYRIMP
jgi:hypothetical protein